MAVTELIAEFVHLSAPLCTRLRRVPSLTTGNPTGYSECLHLHRGNARSVLCWLGFGILFVVIVVVSR